MILLLQCMSPLMCRFSDAGKTCSPRAHAAGVRKAPRHEIAVGRAPGGAASAMGIWAGRGCQCDLMAAVRMIALGQKIAESTLKARPMRCAAAPPLASSRHTGPQPHPKSARTTRTNPHSARCPAGCPTHRDFVPWRFSDAGRMSAWRARLAGVRKPAQ